MTLRAKGKEAGAAKARVAKVRQALVENRLDAFVTFNLKNVRYLSGFSGSTGAALVTAKEAILFTDFRYELQVMKEVSGLKPEVYKGALSQAVGERLKKIRAKRAGFEDGDLSVAQFTQLKKASDRVKWAPSDIVGQLRIIKDEGEINLIKRNFVLLEKVFSKIGKIMSVGKTESSVAAKLEYELKILGGEKPAFDFIVASGERGAMPHGVASSKIIKKGDCVVLDWGWVLDGYNSDNTRTLFMGRPKPKMREIFDITLEANMRAINRVAPGVPIRDIDAAARDFITERGYGKQFGHGTGHGVGLDIHEWPSVSARSADIAREGMVFTIEPGIYLPGVGGVRIEDVVVVTSKGCELISKGLPKDLRVL